MWMLRREQGGIVTRQRPKPLRPTCLQNAPSYFLLSTSKQWPQSTTARAHFASALGCNRLPKLRRRPTSRCRRRPRRPLQSRQQLRSTPPRRPTQSMSPPTSFTASKSLRPVRRSRLELPPRRACHAPPPSQALAQLNNLRVPFLPPLALDFLNLSDLPPRAQSRRLKSPYTTNSSTRSHLLAPAPAQPMSVPRFPTLKISQPRLKTR
jgi:hypothetical protein